MIATNNGSYPLGGTEHGAELEAALARFGRGEIAADDLRLLQDRATRQALDEQARAGIDLPTDGLVRRLDPVRPLASGLGGMAVGETRQGFPGSGGRYSVPLVVSEVSWSGPILVEDFLFASRGTAGTVKPVLVGPFTLAHVAEDRAYGDRLALAMALASALNQELRALQGSGAAFIQIDEPALLARRDEFPIFTRVWEILGRGITATLSLHLEGAAIDGLLPGIARLKRLGCLSLDCVKGLASLDRLDAAALPDTLRVGLGVVDGRSAAIESAEAIVNLVRSATGLPPADRILLGTASDLGGLTSAAAAAKLEALARAVRLLGRD